MTLVFATANRNKADEIEARLPNGFSIKTLPELGFTEDIPETAETLEGNARLKAAFLAENLGVDGFADDTGLEVEALNGAPGVYSARYAGEEKDPEKNMDLLLAELNEKPNRKARFRTVIVLFLNGEYHEFEGIVNGEIRAERSGSKGFGYDPLFEPENLGKTFAEMSMQEKNEHSHRARAFDKMIAFLQTANGGK